MDKRKRTHKKVKVKGDHPAHENERFVVTGKYGPVQTAKLPGVLKKETKEKEARENEGAIAQTSTCL